jgi:hypothetical protein
MTVNANVSSNKVLPDVLSVLSGSSSRPLRLKALERPSKKLTAKFAKESQSPQREANLSELCGRSLRPLRFKIF